MGKCLTLDQKTKKLYLLIILIWIFYIILFIIIDNELLIDLSIYIHNIKFIYNVARIMVILPYLIRKIILKFYKEKINDNKLELKKKAFSNNNLKKIYIILTLNIINSFLYYFLALIFTQSFSYINDAILLFFLSFFMKFYTDFQFYRHKIFALVLFSTFAIFIDKIFFYININLITILANIFIQLLLSINYTYQQYLISIKNISIYKVCSFFGFIDLIFLIFINVLGNKLGNQFLFKNEYIDNEHYKQMVFTNFKIFPILIPFIIIYCIIIIIRYLIIYYFSFNHHIIIDVFVFILRNSNSEIRSKQNIGFYIFLGINVIFILISIFIYLELIELKCCGLNKNTRRNILKREKMENMEIDGDIYKEDEEDDFENNKIEISKGYLLDLKNMNNSIL